MRLSPSSILVLVIGMTLVLYETAIAQDIPAIHVYGPGGPSPAMLECARAFNSRSGANVIVTSGPTSRWKDAAAHDADMFYSGAENMMTDFVRTFNAQIDETTIEPIYVRPAVVMVHPGNPLKIERFADLLRPGVKIMIVQGSGQTGLWEDIAGRVGDVATIIALRRNIVAFEPDTATAHDVWNSTNSPDAWIALASEHGAHPEESDLIQLEPNLVIVRDAGIALTKAGGGKPSAKAFYDFVRSPEGKAIFKRWGWSD
jgi:accessory colonization factor AcfC